VARSSSPLRVGGERRDCVSPLGDSSWHSRSGSLVTFRSSRPAPSPTEDRAETDRRPAGDRLARTRAPSPEGDEHRILVSPFGDRDAYPPGGASRPRPCVRSPRRRSATARRRKRAPRRDSPSPRLDGWIALATPVPAMETRRRPVGDGRPLDSRTKQDATLGSGSLKALRRLSLAPRRSRPQRQPVAEVSRGRIG
jgi:hypothetical protein